MLLLIKDIKLILIKDLIKGTLLPLCFCLMHYELEFISLKLHDVIIEKENVMIFFWNLAIKYILKTLKSMLNNLLAVSLLSFYLKKEQIGKKKKGTNWTDVQECLYCFKSKKKT